MSVGVTLWRRSRGQLIARRRRALVSSAKAREDGVLDGGWYLPPRAVVGELQLEDAARLLGRRTRVVERFAALTRQLEHVLDEREVDVA